MYLAVGAGAPCANFIIAVTKVYGGVFHTDGVDVYFAILACDCRIIHS